MYGGRVGGGGWGGGGGGKGWMERGWSRTSPHRSSQLLGDPFSYALRKLVLVVRLFRCVRDTIFQFLF